MSATLTTLVNFTGTDGATPHGSLIADANGNLFGTTQNGGASGVGTVFEIAKTATGYASTPTTLVSFDNSDGGQPRGSLIADAAGNLFGTTQDGNGNGTVFEIAKTTTGFASTPTTLTFFLSGSFENGADPQGSLIADAAGNLFGTTFYGGESGFGTVFEIAKTATGYASAPTILVSFNNLDGANPYADSLIADAQGDLFGTTSSAAPGSSGVGTVFEIAKTATGYASAPTTLVNFNGTDGAGPHGSLIADAAGNLFGTTGSGGTSGNGTVFEIAKTATGYANTPTTLVNFNYTDGGEPLGNLIADADGNLFGTTAVGGTSGAGTVFEIAKTATGYAGNPTTLVNFNGTDGAFPFDSLIADAAGNLFGTTSSGGTSGNGTVFEITGSGFATSPIPTVMPDLSHATFGTTINVAAAGVLANDTPSVTGDTLTVSAVDGLSQNVGTAVAGAYGTLTLDADGSYSYNASGPSALPSSGVSEDFFGYTALEGGPAGGGSASSTLSVVVTAPGLTYVAAPVGGSATQPNGGHYAVLDGTAGNATLNAANGVGAALVGGNGDTLNGANSGKDTFVFMGDFGKDTVNNYNGKANGNFDVIQLSKSDFKSLTAVQSAATQTPGSANTVITDPINHDTITLAGVSLSSLHFDASHFLLV